MATKEAQREYQRKWMAARRANWFRDKCCVRCGSKTNLEIDHIDPLTKVSHYVWSWAEERRNAELAKCQVLCRPCHQAKSVDDLVNVFGVVLTVHGRYKMYQRGCRCRPCKDASAAYKRDYRARTRSALAAA
jgi:hypothetical protein